jgi:phosphate butyryltransferase
MKISVMQFSDFSFLFELLKARPKKRLVVANGVDVHSIEALALAQRSNIVSVILTGKRSEIEESCQQLGISADMFEIVDCNNDLSAVEMAVKMVRSHDADLIMKGLISTDKFMKFVLNKEIGLLPAGGLLSHVTVVLNERYGKPLVVSDVAIIPLPTLEQKVVMTENVIKVARAIGIAEPKVAFIAATEQVIQKMPATTDAFELKKMWLDNRFPGSVCDGPLSLDLAIDKESARIKKYESEVAGNANCLVFPNIESGNVFYKTNTKLCDAKIAAVLVGTTSPAVLSSRGDSADTKLNSIALAALLS